MFKVDVPNIVHLFQTAERIREKHPENRWFQLTGLVHDIGKLMALYGEPQVQTGSIENFEGVWSFVCF